MVIHDKRHHPLLENLEDYWPCTRGLSAANVIGTQLRDLIKLETGPMAVGGIEKWTMTPPRKAGEESRK